MQGKRQIPGKETVYNRQKKCIRKKMAVCVILGLLFFCHGNSIVCGAEPAPPESEPSGAPVTVVLDPGHGGENLGGEYPPYQEKDLTLITALTMKEELEKYEGIRVYLTRDSDVDLSLEDRVKFAVEKEADFLFCLHYNMSLNHDLFGAEVWVSAFGEQYQAGYTFADAQMKLLTEHGLYSRGIKTRMNDKGEDYYGILRHATAASLPAVIIEHCHMDQERDRSYYTSEEGLREFGRLDATAVARYYGLTSKLLGADYSGYRNVQIPLPSLPVRPDTTEPDICVIEVTDVDETTGNIRVELSAQDYDSSMLYYSFSFDGGTTFSGLEEWPEAKEDTVSFTIHAPSGILPEIVVRAYNGFDLYTESNHVLLPSLAYEDRALDPKGDAAQAGQGMESAGPGTRHDTGQDGDLVTPQGADRGISEKGRNGGTADQKKPQATLTCFLTVCLICVAILFVLLLLARILLLSGGGKKSAGRHGHRKGRR